VNIITLAVYQEFPASPEGNDPMGNVSVRHFKTGLLLESAILQAEEMAQRFAEQSGRHVQVWDVAPE
jgi:hypothetical protein